MILCKLTVTHREIGSRGLRMEGVVVQRIGKIDDAMRRSHSDHGIIDRIWHSSVESPVPVWDPEGDGCCLIQASLV